MKQAKQCFFLSVSLLAGIVLTTFVGCTQTTPVRANLILSNARVVDKDSYMVSGGRGTPSHTEYYIRVYAGKQVYQVDLSEADYSLYNVGDNFKALVPRESDLK